MTWTFFESANPTVAGVASIFLCALIVFGASTVAILMAGVKKRGSKAAATIALVFAAIPAAIMPTEIPVYLPMMTALVAFRVTWTTHAPPRPVTEFEYNSAAGIPLRDTPTDDHRPARTPRTEHLPTGAHGELAR